MQSERRPVPATSDPRVETGHAPEPGLVVEIAGLRRTLTQAARLFVETVVVPTALLAILLHAVGLMAGLAAALGWCYLTVLVRWFSGRRMPGTLLLYVAMLSGRAGVALVTSSAVVYLLQPVAGSVFMALLFLGSAALGRPVTMRLARDFVTLPAHILNRRGVRRMFTQVALLWGVSRLFDAVMNLGFLHWGLAAGLLSRGVLSPLLTITTVALCTYWGWRSLRRDGVRLRLTGTVAGAVA